MEKLVNFMVEDDGIRAELIAGMAAEADGSLDWLSQVSSDAQKQSVAIIIVYGSAAQAVPGIGLEE